MIAFRILGYMSAPYREWKELDRNAPHAGSFPSTGAVGHNLCSFLGCGILQGNRTLPKRLLPREEVPSVPPVALRGPWISCQ
jgi:hypothetical protein